MDYKRNIRKQMISLKEQMTEEDIRSRSSVLCKKLIDSDEYKKADILLSYVSANQEVRTNDIIRQAIADHKIAAVPVTFEKNQMEFVRYDSVGSYTLKRGIEEPAGGTILQIINEPAFCQEGFTCELLPVESHILILMPGLAFGLDMNRIGYGGGFYDRYVQRLERAGYSVVKASLCYDFQVFDTLECEAHDIPLDILISA